MRFRVWDKEKETMNYPYPVPDDVYYVDKFGIDLSGKLFLVTETGQAKYLTLKQRKNFRVMLSTELYDLNNKEIFELDIVQLKGKNGLYIVCFGQCFAYQSDEDNYIGFFLRKVNEDPNIHYTLFPKDYNRVDCYVVGNIYQNEELLGGGQP